MPYLHTLKKRGKHNLFHLYKHNKQLIYKFAWNQWAAIHSSIQASTRRNTNLQEINELQSTPHFMQVQDETQICRTSMSCNPLFNSRQNWQPMDTSACRKLEAKDQSIGRGACTRPSFVHSSKLHSVHSCAKLLTWQNGCSTCSCCRLRKECYVNKLCMLFFNKVHHQQYTISIKKNRR